MTLQEIKEEAAALPDSDLQELEEWIRAQLDPHPAQLEESEGVDAITEPEEVTYRLKYFKCGKKWCRCSRGVLHGPYLYTYTRTREGRSRRAYVGKVTVERQDEERQLVLEFR
jgi:hypothetical protein